jgi:hypothetical protein
MSEFDGRVRKRKMKTASSARDELGALGIDILN